MNSNTPQPDSPTFRAKVLAAAIVYNCDQFNADAIDRDAWHEEQRRLWNMAAEMRIASEVMAVIAPSARR